MSIRYSFLGNYIAGGFFLSNDANVRWSAVSPADLSCRLVDVSSSYRAVDECVDSAKGALKQWRKKSMGQRAEYLKKYQAALLTREADLVDALVYEVGKPQWEAKAEVSAMASKVDHTLGEGARGVEDFEIPGESPGQAGKCRHRALGVLAVVGPFNFPGHLPNGHIVPALLTGNTVIFKPSEKAPIVGQIMAECFHAAGFPAGVFNLLQGEKEIGRRLIAHEGITGVLFTGSAEVGTRIKQDTLLQHWKLLSLQMGGKNPAVVWSDANLDHATSETLVSSFITAGQRCSATSRILVHEKVYDQFVSQFHERAKKFSIGHPKNNPFMGPLIDSQSVDRNLKFLGIASREGCEVLMRGKQLELGALTGHYVSPSICLVKDAPLESVKKSVYQQTELFSPNVAITKIQDDLGAVAPWANATQYGLVASVFTQSSDIYHAIREDLEFGLVNWNRGTVGASSRLPFGGLKKSGNHFPTALFASRYCVAPVSSLEMPEPTSPQDYPGLLGAVKGSSS